MSDWEIWWSYKMAEFKIGILIILTVVSIAIGVGLFQVAREMVRNAWNSLKRKK